MPSNNKHVRVNKSDRALAVFERAGLQTRDVEAALVNRISAETSAKFETQTDSGVAKYGVLYPESDVPDAEGRVGLRGLWGR